MRAREPARCAWVMAQASASAASACSTPQVGSSRRTIACTCSFCAWPTPTTDFLIRFVAYSAISSPACAPASSATARAWPILSAADGSLATKASSTAIAVGRDLDDHLFDRAMQCEQAKAKLLADRGDGRLQPGGFLLRGPCRAREPAEVPG